MRKFSLAFAALILGAAGAGAQVANSGVGTPNAGGSPTDPSWDFSCSILVVGMAACNTTGEAFIPLNIPSPPWQPNTGPTGPNWISAWQNASSTSGTGNNVSNYEYNFWTTVGSSGFYGLNLGWDNQLVGVYQNGILLYGPSTPSGFCRDADGVFPTGAWPNCLVSTVLALDSDYRLDVIVRGDGTTDGLYAEFDNAGRPLDVIPEPATMGLLATGLAGLMGAGLRRRRKS